MTTHVAPGPAAGYLFQPERALSWLATSPSGSVVGIETEDDVVVHLPDGNIVFEQDKHVTSSRTPLADRSRDLWNTLAIWLTAVREGRLDLSRCCLHIVTNARLPDCLARRISAATDSCDAHACVKELIAAAVNPPCEIADLCPKVLRDTSLLASLITCVRCYDADDRTSGPQLRRTIASQLHLSDDLPADDIIDGLSGWLHRLVLDHWRVRQPALIARGAFDRQYQRQLAFYRQIKRLGLPRHLVRFSKEERRRYTNATYVRQLRLVNVPGDEVTEAIDDYICCSRELFRLFGEGEITVDDQTAFEDRLFDQWKAIARRIKRFGAGQPKEELGCRILYDTLAENAPFPQELPEPYLARGTYHRLAERVRIGWHPDYADLLPAPEKL